MARVRKTGAAAARKGRAASAGATRRRASRAARPARHAPADVPLVKAWIDDPGSGLGLMECPAPDAAAAPLAFRIVGRAVRAGLYEPGTRAFRHWNAATALCRVAGCWAPLLARHAVTQWQGGATLDVALDSGTGLDAYYDRTRLAFLRSGTGASAIHAGDSPDILCHEAGHACLDALRPDLWDAPFIETSAFHESFADISALLAALALPQVRRRTLSALTAGRSSPLSRIAEQLGKALRRSHPGSAGRTCLRDAAKVWKYVPPESLPDGPGSDTLTAEPHSFSRVFTGAFHEILSRLVRARAARPTADDLAAVAGDAARLLVDALSVAPVSPDFFARVAAAMIDADASARAGAQARAGAYGELLAAVFAERAILPATPRATRPSARRGGRGTAQRGAAVAPAAGRMITIDAARFGLETDGILVEMPGGSAPGGRAVARSVAGVAGAEASTHAVERFVEGLFENRRVELPAGIRGRGQAGVACAVGGRGTHALCLVDGHMRLVRLRFECGRTVSRPCRNDDLRPLLPVLPLTFRAEPGADPGGERPGADRYPG